MIKGNERGFRKSNVWRRAFFWRVVLIATVILNNVLQCEVVELLKKQGGYRDYLLGRGWLTEVQVEDDIAREIEQLVEEQVALVLKDHIPQDLQDEVADQQRILEEVRRDLHNSWVFKWSNDGF